MIFAYAQNPLQRERAISHLQTEMGFLRTSVTAYAIDKNTFSAPFGIFYVRAEILKQIFKKNPT